MAVSRTAITGPFKGIISDLPPTVVPNGFEDAVNFIGWKGRIRTRPGLNPFILSPDALPLLNMTSFQDIVGFFHTLALTQNDVYMLTPGPAFNQLLFPSAYINSVVVNAGGTGYNVDDIINIIQGGANAGTAQVNEVDPTTGKVLELVLLTRGKGYTTAAGLTTIGGAGVGLTVDITSGSLTSLGGPNATNLPYAVVKANSRVYFCNGSVPVCFSDGEDNFKIAGNVPGSCRYLTVNQNHMIGAVWSEPDPTQPDSFFFPNRVRWSDSGNYDQWDETLDTSTAGVVDVIDTPDVITGLSTLGTYSYLYRTNGISILQPTGNAASPFYIPNYSVSPKGEGCTYPYSLVTHNNIDRFIGNSDVFAFDGSNLVPLMEGKCNAKFFSDLQGAQGTVRGIMTTVLDNGFQFLGYALTIPGSNVAWILNVVEGSWTRLTWAPPVPGYEGAYDLQFIEQVITL